MNKTRADSKSYAGYLFFYITCPIVDCQIFLHCSKIVLVAIQDEAQRKMYSPAYAALRRIGARSPMNAGYRASFALIGYTGPGRPSFIKQVKY